MIVVNKISVIMGIQRLTIAEVAKKAGLSYEAVRRLYDGDSKRVDFDTLGKLCDVLQCDVGDLLTCHNNTDQLKQIQPSIAVQPCSHDDTAIQTGDLNETEALLAGLF